MKLWIFNVLVAGALAYLFLGESEQSRVKSDLEWAKEKVETSIDKSRSGDDVEADRKSAERSAPRPGILNDGANRPDPSLRAT